MINSIDFTKYNELLSNSASIIITTHFNPDGDAVGSALALYHVLKGAGYEVSVIIPNRFPDFLGWMADSEKIIIFEEAKNNRAKLFIERADLIFCLDYNALNRIGKMEESIKTAKGFKVLIDHHPNPQINEFQLVYSFTSASSTAELVCNFVEQTGLIHLINKEAAECFYAGIITDTGSFSFSCNSARTYQIMALLIEKGIDAENLHRLIYDNFSESRIRLLGYALSQKMLVLSEFHCAIIWLTKQDLDNFNYQIGDSEGLVNYPLSIKEINLSILLTEKENLIRISFRSKGKFAANKIAFEYFDGGGHANAAGGNSYLSMEATIDKIKEILPKFKENLNYIVSKENHL
jgi:phosphoesterase RecJ-like protein